MEDNASNILINWYLTHKRELPWRETIDPYYIWVSEIILQQTRVQQGLPYYLRFIEEFSTVTLLAEAPLEKILKLWQGLGYYSRARNMHIAAKQIVEQYNSLFPTTYKELLNLRGVGEYTAAAVASISFNEPVAVVDGNVVRVISRLFAIQEPVDKPSVLKVIKEIAASLLTVKNPAFHNQAMMEFGALHCIPVKPDCLMCPLTNKCLAFKYNIVEILPFKKAKVAVKNRFFYYLIIHENEGIYFQKRIAGDIWEGLFEFPLIITEELVSDEELPQIIENVLGTSFKIVGISGPIQHILTHQRLQVNFIHIKFENLLTKKPLNWIWTRTISMHELAVPRVIDRYMQTAGFNKFI